MSSLTALGDWFEAQADGEWEHRNEIRVVSLDNPGWAISIPLIGTSLELETFTPIHDEHGDSWVRCWKTDSHWEAACDPRRLDEAISQFVAWAREVGGHSAAS